MSRIIALVATIPARRRTCERLLGEISRQRLQPDVVALVLDGYGVATPAPACPLPTLEFRTEKSSGCGVRWRAPEGLDDDDILINLDDDYQIEQAPTLIRGLVDTVESGGGAAAAMGFTFPEGKRAVPGPVSRGLLLFGAGCGLSIRAKHLPGIRALAEEVRAAGGPDTLGPLGNDDALVSAYCWVNKIPLMHAPTGVIHAAPGTRASSQTAARTNPRVPKREDPDAQKVALRRITGWPWVSFLKDSPARRGQIQTVANRQAPGRPRSVLARKV